MQIQVDPMKRESPKGKREHSPKYREYCEIPDLWNPDNQREYAFKYDKYCIIKRRRENESERKRMKTRESQMRESRRVVPQTRGSRPGFKPGHEKNADADVSSRSR